VIGWHGVRSAPLFAAAHHAAGVLKLLRQLVDLLASVQPQEGTATRSLPPPLVTRLTRAALRLYTCLVGSPDAGDSVETAAMMLHVGLLYRLQGGMLSVWATCTSQLLYTLIRAYAAAVCKPQPMASHIQQLLTTHKVRSEGGMLLCVLQLRFRGRLPVDDVWDTLMLSLLSHSAMQCMWSAACGHPNLFTHKTSLIVQVRADTVRLMDGCCNMAGVGLVVAGAEHSRQHTAAGPSSQGRHRAGLGLQPLGASAGSGRPAV
jgi:hypothetical protein